MTTNTILIGTSLRGGPVSRHFAALGLELIALGYQVIILAHGPIQDESYVDPQISVLRWPSPRPTRFSDMLFFDRLVRQNRPCCLISNFGAMAIMMSVGSLRQVPVRIHWHHTLSSQIGADWPGSRTKLRLLRWRARILFNFATHVVANSDAARQDVVDTYHAPPRKCQVFWNCLEDPLRSISPSAVNGKNRPKSGHFACVGRFNTSKGQDVLLRALVEVSRKHPEITVEFIGDGPERIACEELAMHLGVSRNCNFTGALPHPKVLSKMAGMWATIVPSRNEAFGLVNIESMSVGVPVLGSNTGGITEIVRDGIDGFLFPPGDYQALARQMIELMENEDLRAAMAKNVRLRFLESFESSRAVQTQARWIIEQFRISLTPSSAKVAASSSKVF